MELVILFLIFKMSIGWWSVSYTHLEEILILAGYKVFAAENGKTGVTKAQEHVPDLILCDIMMPELDGYGVLRILGSQPKTSDIPFIFLTAKTEREDFRKGMGLGADDYITCLLYTSRCV